MKAIVMQLHAKFLADESLNGKFLRHLQSIGVEVVSISSIQSGISDTEDIEIAKSSDRITITEDTDFGEWVFVHKTQGISVILLRYSKADSDRIQATLLKVIDSTDGQSSHQFIVITKNKIRKRPL